MFKRAFATLVLLAVGVFAACSQNSHPSPDVTETTRKSLDQAGLRSVSVRQDRQKGVVTLSGNVPADSDKAQAESIANSAAGGQVVANEIAVVPPHDEGDAKTVNADLDKGIDKEVDAALIQNRLQHGVRHEVKNGVVTLTGTVNSEARRAEVEKVASAVPNVQQVVNELQVRNQKATTTAARQ